MKNQNDTNNEMSSETKRPLDRSKLGDLYPTPKTYDELEERNMQARLRQQARRPKHVALSASLSMSFVIVGIVAMASNMTQLIYANIITTVSFLFLLGLATTGFVYWQYRRIANFFAEKGYGSIPFFVTYFMSAIPLLGGCYQLSSSLLPAIYTYLLMGMINIVLMYSLIAVATSSRLGVMQKTIVFAVTIVASVAFATALSLGVIDT